MLSNEAKRAGFKIATSVGGKREEETYIKEIHTQKKKSPRRSQSSLRLLIDDCPETGVESLRGIFDVLGDFRVHVTDEDVRHEVRDEGVERGSGRRRNGGAIHAAHFGVNRLSRVG